MKDYHAIGLAFERAIGNIQAGASFKTAILSMKKFPHLVEKISAWDEMVWLCVEEFLNSGHAELDEDAQSCFFNACALLEQ